MKYSKEFLARVYGAYMGADVQGKCVEYDFGMGGGDHHYTLVGRLVSVSTKEIIITDMTSDMGDTEVVDYEGAKLLLTTLSAIADEDCFGLCKIIGFSGYDINPDSAAHFDFNPDDVRDNLANAGEEFLSGTFTETQKAIDYLRSKGYDCGYAHINSLIESGLAIDKTTLNN